MEIEHTSSYVIMLDIVETPERGGSERATCFDKFIGLLEANVEVLKKWKKFNIFPTGDGAIICIYDKDVSSSEIIEAPLIFSRNILKANKNNDFHLKISINYGDMERIIDVSDFDPIHTDQIQVGDGINIAERIIHFCEPKEILWSEEYHKRLYHEGIDKKYKWKHYPEVFVKHMDALELYSYSPFKDEEEYIYSFKGEKSFHDKKYAYFPPIKESTFQQIKKVGLQKDLGQICDYAYDTLASINKDQIFISWDTVYETLKKIPTEQENEILVISRDDLEYDFWSTKDAQGYLQHLETVTDEFKQIRIFIYDPKIESMTPKKVVERLVRLHSKGTLKKIDKAYIDDNILLKYVFGVTIFPNLKCAIAPLPVPKSYNDYVKSIRPTRVENIFPEYGEYDFSRATFKALVIFNAKKVDELVKAFSSLKKDKRIVDISDRALEISPSHMENKSSYIFCPQCKNRIQKNWVACPICGMKLK